MKLKDFNDIIDKYADDSIYNPLIVVDIAKDVIESLGTGHQEQVIVLGLDAVHKLQYIDFISLGIVNECLIHCRELFRNAILERAVGIIVIHNHPSGDINPSPEDNIITDQIQRAGLLIGIPLIDHVIVDTGDGVGKGGKRYVSYKQENLLEEVNVHTLLKGGTKINSKKYIGRRRRLGKLG